jgi:DNA-binding CsgD family transcriptional regulator/PAS domain-containing protein
MNIEQKALELVGKIYDAAVEPELWEHFLREAACVLEASSGALVAHDLANADINRLITSGFDERILRQYAEHIHKVEIWVDVPENPPNETMILSQEHCTNRQTFQTEMYQDCGRRQGAFHVTEGFVARDEGRFAKVGFQRPVNADPFHEGHRTLLNVLAPHLQRAFQLNRKFWEQNAHSKGMSALLDRLAVGVILLDEEERVVFVNRAAAALLRDNHGLHLRQKMLCGETTGETAALRKLVHEAISTGNGNGNGLSPGGGLTLHDKHGEPMHVQVCPLRTERTPIGLAHESPRAAVFVSAPGKRPVPPEEALQALFRLTPAEGRLAVGLAEGQTLEEIAESFGITKGTARVQLKSIFSKTDTRRQAELVRIVLTSSPAIAGG